MNMLPLTLLTLVITVYNAFRSAAAMNAEVQNELVNLCYTIVHLYDIVDEGDYHIEDNGNAFHMMKGEKQLDSDFLIIDPIKEKTGVDITFFIRIPAYLLRSKLFFQQICQCNPKNRGICNDNCKR